MIWRELVRRHVLRNCAIYLVLWLALVQLLQMLLSAWGYDADDSSRVLILAGLLLLPVVIALSWFFHIAPRDFRRHGKAGERRQLRNIAPLNERRTLPAPGADPLQSSRHAWELTAETGPLQGLRYAIAKPLLIGRARDCDLALVSDLVSRHHARLTPQGDTLLLEDLGSANGTHLNGQLVDGPQQLACGDIIQIRNISFRVTATAASARGEQAAASDEGAVPRSLAGGGQELS